PRKPYMERETSRNKKRTRDGGEDVKGFRKGKKQEISVNITRDPCENTEKAQHEFCEGIGIFDFPWLKEGVVFIADECLESEEMLFGPCSFVDEAYGTFAENFYRPHDEYNLHDKKLDDEFWLLEINGFEPIDCIWSCIDHHQPLDTEDSLCHNNLFKHASRLRVRGLAPELYELENRRKDFCKHASRRSELASSRTAAAISANTHLGAPRLRELENRRSDFCKHASRHS
ncbi:Unknown protein, partial [Striga hermonthica]